MCRPLLLIALFTLTVAAQVQADDELKAFPAAEDGRDRFVLHLPELEDESLVKVELIVGKTLTIDGLNRYFFGGSLETVSIPGWGYDRYVLETLGPVAGTRIAVDPSEPKEPRFITLGGEPFMIRYNSKLPVVIYVPSGVEVRYRLWRTEPQADTIPKG